MDDELRKEILRKQLIKQHHGKHQVTAKYTPKYPDSVEREYIRMVNALMSMESGILKKHIPELKRIIMEGDNAARLDDTSDNEEKRKAVRRSGLVSVLRRIEELFESIESELRSAFGLFGLSKAIQAIADLDEKLSTKEWKKTVKKTFGIDLLEDYYQGDFYSKAIEEWISDNVDLIKTIPHDSLGKIKQMVYENYMSGKTSTSIVKEIQRQYGMDKRHARFIAKDQTAKLNSKITQKQQRDAGVTMYEWSTSGDQRVRRGDKVKGGAVDPMGDNHKRLEGMVCSWDDPPLVDRKRGRRCHPGQDYQCRCCALPVFDLDNLDLPM